RRSPELAEVLPASDMQGQSSAVFLSHTHTHTHTHPALAECDVPPPLSDRAETAPPHTAERLLITLHLHLGIETHTETHTHTHTHTHTNTHTHTHRIDKTIHT